MSYDMWLLSGPGGPHDANEPPDEEMDLDAGNGTNDDDDDEVQEWWNPETERYEPYRPSK